MANGETVKVVRKSGSVSQVGGKTLAELTAGRDGGPLETLKFDFEYPELQKGAEIPEAEKPDADEILAVVNGKRQAKARSKAQQDILEANNVEVPSMSVKTPEGALANIVRSLVAQGRTKEDAEQVARGILGM